MAAAALVSSLLATSACVPPREAETAPEAEDLPAFTASEAALFDDTVSLRLFDPTLADVPPASDPKLGDRALRSDVIVAVKVSTVTRDKRGESLTYQLSVTPTEGAIVGSPGPEAINLEVSSQSPSFPFVKAADVSLVGQTMILMFKRYNEDGQVGLHWHLEVDSNEVRTAIAQARALEEMGT